MQARVFRGRRRGRPLILACLYMVFMALGPSGAVASICDAAAATAAAEVGVPLTVLRAITRTETGRTLAGELAPWPWSANIEGQGFWFDTKQEAMDFVAARTRSGHRSIDVGCFQINTRWHGQHFASLTDMFDPERNALYAAKFLTELHAETGDWLSAVGAYHSKTPKFAARYTARFEQILDALPPAPGRRPQSFFSARQPLPGTAGSARAIGSLTPLGRNPNASAFIQF